MPKRTNISTRPKFVDIQSGGREGRADTVLRTDHAHNHGIIITYYGEQIILYSKVKSAVSVWSLGSKSSFPPTFP